MAESGEQARLRYHEPGGDVVSQEFEDETIVIRLETGMYYSLNPSAAALWRLCCAGYTLEEAADAWRGPAEAPREEMAAVWTRLVESQLVLPALPGALPPGQAPPATLTSPPRMTEYSDMQDLFALDPVHDVDETGWPSTQPEVPANRR